MLSFLNLLTIDRDNSNPFSTLHNPHSCFSAWFSYWCLRLIFFALALLCLHCLIDYTFLGVRPWKLSYNHTKHNHRFTRVRIKHRIIVAIIAMVILVPLILSFLYCGVTLTTKDSIDF